MNTKNVLKFLYLCIAILLFIPCIAWAEVMDKEPSILSIWSWSIAGSFFGFLATKFRRWLILVTLPIPLLFFVSLFSEIYDPYVGPAIKSEAGFSYVVHVYMAFGLLFLSHIVCFWAGKKVKTNS